MFKLNKKIKLQNDLTDRIMRRIKANFIVFFLFVYFVCGKFKQEQQLYKKKNKMSTKKNLLNNKSPSDGNF